MPSQEFDKPIAGEGRYFRFNEFGPLGRWQVGDYVRIPGVHNMTHDRRERIYKVTDLAIDGMARGELVAEDGKWLDDQD